MPWFKVVLSTVNTTKLKILTMSIQTKHEHSPSCLSVASISQQSIPKSCIRLRIDSIMYYYASTELIPDDTTGVTLANLLNPELHDFLIPPCNLETTLDVDVYRLVVCAIGQYISSRRAVAAALSGALRCCWQRFQPYSIFACKGRDFTESQSSSSWTR